MKFEKFLKNAGMCGAIVDCQQYGKFLCMGTVMMRIPDGANVLAAFKRRMKTFEFDIFKAYEDGESYTAELTGATLPTPDAKSSQIERIFSDQDGGKIAIDNKTFGLIERMDGVRMVFDDEEPAALVITEGYGDDEIIAGVIFSEEYYMNTMEG
jgi:hypothetical protein